ncbi:MAG: Ribosomal RNA small subunit methyltransferase B [Candidatus Thorarchaeota archaeon]|nr:MAG: Ribosomal RNA small subunit methyltransferase B [Candidatus Thorarchaeota archaeon]
MAEKEDSEQIAREHAIRILVEYDKSSQSLKSLLREKYDSYQELHQYRGLVESLTFETIKYLNTIDWLISRYGAKSAKQMSVYERNLLRLVIYEGRWLKTSIRTLLESYLYKIPEMVSTVRKILDSHLDKAILSLPIVNRLSIKFAHPTFLVETLLDNLPEEEVIQLMRANNGPRSYFIRPNKLVSSTESMIEMIGSLDVHLTRDSDVSDLFLVENGIDNLVRSKLFTEGNVLVQDKASMLSVLALDPKPGEIIWDACAAPGMKTQLISELTHSIGTIYASESSPERIEIAKKRANILGYSSVKWLLADASSVPIENADKILIDAPCSSTGIIWSYPSFKWQLNKNSLMALMAVQNKILDSIIEAYQNRPGTEIVYATCSILPHEGESQIDSVMDRYSFLELVKHQHIGSMGYTSFKCKDHIQRYFPHIHNTSGFFISHLRITD